MRSGGSLRVKWKNLARDTQIFLAARNSMISKPASGMKSFNLEEMEIHLYCSRPVEKDKDGEIQFAPPFKFVDASEFLSSHPKFGGKNDEDILKYISATSYGSTRKRNQGSNTSGPGVLCDDSLSEERYFIVSASSKKPIGSKRMKKEHERSKKEEQFIRKFFHIHEEMKATNDIMRRMADGCDVERKAEREYRLLQVLPPYSSKYKAIIDRMSGRNLEEASDGTADDYIW